MNGIQLRHDLETLRLGAEPNGLTLASLYRRAEHEIAALKQAEKALRLMDLVVEESPSLIAIVGPDHRCERVNPAYGRFFNLPQEKIVGRPVAELLGLDQFDSALKPYLDRGLAGERADFECWLPTKGKDRRYFVVTCVPLRPGRDGVEALSLMLRDLTDRKTMEETLRENQRELQALSGRVLQAQEEERRRIARELHDSIGQTLTDSVIGLQKLVSDLAASPGQAGARLESIATRLAGLADFLHDMARELHPPVLAHAGLRAVLEELCEDFSRQRAISVRFAARGLPPALPKDLEVTLYRVAQECLRNVASHSRARRAGMSLAGVPGGIRLSVVDDGVGFPPADAKAKGLGISGMEERMRLVWGAPRPDEPARSRHESDGYSASADKR